MQRSLEIVDGGFGVDDRRSEVVNQESEVWNRLVVGVLCAGNIEDQTYAELILVHRTGADL